MYINLGALLFITGVITCNGQRCDSNQLRKCREEVARQTGRRVGELSQRDCRQFREQFDCLLDQTVLCTRDESERDEYGGEILSAHSVLKRNCDRVEGWDRNSCYEKDEIRRCEDNMPRRISNADRETCRKYDELRECVERIVTSYCSSNDKAYVRSYYMEVARDLPWRCNSVSSLGSEYSGYTTEYNPYNTYRNRSNEQTCCKSERCEDQDRLRNCRQELIKTIEGRSTTYSYNAQTQCTTLLNNFNCMLWHTYSCQQRHEKDTNTLRDAKRHIESKCDTTGDLRKSRCFEDMTRECDRHLLEESQSLSDVTCREYASFFDCVQRYMERCTSQDELLQGIFLVNKANEQAWMCSKRDNVFTSYPPYGGTRDTYPYNPPDADQYCEERARRDHSKCLSEKDRMEEEARRTNNAKERHTKSCCSAYKFRDCVRQVVREQCQREKSSLVDSLLGPDLVNRIRLCQDVNPSTCSASRMLSNAIILFFAAAIFRSIFQ